VVNEGLISLADERIPSLIDNFLQTVCTQNPTLNVENIVLHGRKAAEHGPGWNVMFNPHHLHIGMYRQTIR
jgi:hypothetical protein